MDNERKIAETENIPDFWSFSLVLCHQLLPSLMRNCPQRHKMPSSDAQYEILQWLLELWQPWLDGCWGHFHLKIPWFPIKESYCLYSCSRLRGEIHCALEDVSRTEFQWRYDAHEVPSLGFCLSWGKGGRKQDNTFRWGPLCGIFT